MVFNRSIVVIDEDSCIGCGRCVRSCPFDAIEMKNDVATVKESLCRGCMRCAAVCPTNAIKKEVI